jgi:precorrin-8X/cobalt-precorrin-8 methylmutase
MSDKPFHDMHDDKPMDIEHGSMAVIESEVPEPRPFLEEQWLVVRRMIHTTADFEMLDLVRFHPDAVAAGKKALAQGCTIFTDSEMARVGITRRRMDRLGCHVVGFMSHPDVAQRAEAEGITRSMAAVDRLAAQEDARIIVIGNAPTALLRLLEHIRDDRLRPDLVVGVPVGFINAAESKELLMAQDEVPFIAIQGRKGGSALAASAVNALADMALENRDAG